MNLVEVVGFIVVFHRRRLGGRATPSYSDIMLTSVRQQTQSGASSPTVPPDVPTGLVRSEQVGEPQIAYHLPKPRHHGCTALSLLPLEFIDHLPALISQPLLHRHSYHGVLAGRNRTEIASAAAFGAITNG